jgi:hypothetical protein
MMSGVQHTAPENPHTLALDIEEWNGLKPPVCGRLARNDKRGIARVTNRSMNASTDCPGGNTSAGGGSGEPRNSPKNRLSESN